MSNLSAFLTMLAASEGTAGIGDDGYNVIVGSSKQQPILFGSYLSHPRLRVWIKGINDYSTAAGRYQILARYYDAYKIQLKLPDFSPKSQDAIAIQMINECGTLADIGAGRIETAIYRCRSRWASLTGAGYGQHENSIDTLRAAYLQAGGKLP